MQRESENRSKMAMKYRCRPVDFLINYRQKDCAKEDMPDYTGANYNCRPANGDINLHAAAIDVGRDGSDDPGHHVSISANRTNDGGGPARYDGADESRDG